MDVSIIIISYNTCGLLRDCLVSVHEKTAGIGCEIYVVDNASHDDSCEMVEREFPSIHLIRNKDNRGFAKANNQAIPRAKGEYILLLNSDTLLENNAVKLMREFMEAHPRAAVCGPLLLNADGTVQQSMDTHRTVMSMVARLVLGNHRGWLRKLQGNRYHPMDFDYSKVYRLPDGWLTGAALLIRRSALAEVGLLDEHYHFFMEDADWGLAVSRSGWETWLFPAAKITHLLGGSRKAMTEEKEIALKLNVIRQQRYYVRKNFKMVHRLLFRILLTGCHSINLLYRVISYPLNLKRNGSFDPFFKMRLAYRLFFASMKREV